MCMATKLTKKQREFADKYIETGNGTNSVLGVYNTEDSRTAAVIAHENLTKPNVVNYIQSKLSDELLAKKHLEGLEAVRTIATKDGPIEEPDYAVRHKYLDTAYKVKGSFAPEKKATVNVDVTIPSEKAQKIAEKYESELRADLLS